MSDLTEPGETLETIITARLAAARRLGAAIDKKYPDANGDIAGVLRRTLPPVPRDLGWPMLEQFLAADLIGDLIRSLVHELSILRAHRPSIVSVAAPRAYCYGCKVFYPCTPVRALARRHQVEVPDA